MEDAGEHADFGPPPKYYLESVDNALQLLTLFRTHDRIRVKDASETLSVATGTAHRLLAMLMYRGFITQDPLTRVYLPGAMLLSIGLQAAQGSELREKARPFLEELNQVLDETILLATLQNRQVLFVDAVESSKVLRVTSRVGTLRPAHCTSVGKAMLASLDRQQIVDVFPQESLPKETDRSIGTRRALLKELEIVRSRGYASNAGELEDGIGSVASAITDASGRPVAAIGAGAPLSRLDDRRIEQMAGAVVEAAKRFEATL